MINKQVIEKYQKMLNEVALPGKRVLDSIVGEFALKERTSRLSGMFKVMIWLHQNLFSINIH